MTHEQWMKSVPAAITADVLWKLEAYRLAMFLTDLAWPDATKLGRDQRTRSCSDQLYRSVGSVKANIAEGFSRATGKERARFYEFALGSARETRDWYYVSRHILGEKVCAHRIDITTQIIRLLLKMVANQRRSNIIIGKSRNHVIT